MQERLITESENVINRQVLIVLAQVIDADDGDEQMLQVFARWRLFLSAVEQSSLSGEHGGVAPGASCEQW